MATFRKRNDKWQVQIRRKDYPLQSKSFQLKVDAELWVRKVERAMDNGDPIGTDITLLKELLDKYSDEISITKKGCCSEQYRLKSLGRSWLGRIKLSDLSTKAICKYRDERLIACQPSSVRRELQLLKNVLKVGRVDWGYRVKDCMTDIRFPCAAKARDRRLELGELEAILDHSKGWLTNVILFAIETKREAENWVAVIESEMVRGIYVDRLNQKAQYLRK